MSSPRTFLVATDGQAVLRSHNDGATWLRITPDQDLEFDDCVRCLLPDRRHPNVVFAGAERGLFRTEDCGVTWHQVDCALNGYAIWKLASDEKQPDIMYAGTGSPSRAVFFRSHDAGRSWERTSLEMPPKCLGVSRPRMLAMAIDPDDAKSVWVGVEEGGLFHSTDAGDSWERLDMNWPEHRGNSDIHNIVIFPGTPKTVVVVVVNAIYRSVDGGKTWDRTDVKEQWGIYYSRVAQRKANSANELFLSISDGTPGTTSMFFRSSDQGKTWSNSPLPVQPNSCIWALGSNAADPDLLLAGTKYGDLYRSMDGGKSWHKEWREFSEITDTVWIPEIPSHTGNDHGGH